MDFLRWLFDAKLEFAGGGFLLWREVLGNLFGLASALGGMRRKIWAWPVGILGNALLFTVFMGSVFGSPVYANLLGQAGRQIMFIAVSFYGWHRWHQGRTGALGADDAGASAGAAVQPRWAGAKARWLLLLAMVAGTAALTPLFRALGSYEPVWADAWIFMGSLLATYGMAKGWVEFWLIWVAVDLVGVPLLLGAGYYASAFMYIFYGAFTLFGFFVWWRIRARATVTDGPATPVPDRSGHRAEARP
ncbi:nicotinamide riboside transporter PnuC [Specibacter sp. RAF43]|uniref:nicotinamide riboside transporter PnuC n=1 Tax=Specibacter sp. RAF43 TaxID=3233057 RepID=UPI003F961FDF